MKKTIARIGLPLTVIIILSLLAACAPAEADTATPTPTAGITFAEFPETPEATQEAYLLDGATISDSGLQFLEIEAGTGRTPKAGDLVTMNFIGTLPDGTEFANSFTQGRTVQVVYGKNQLLPGWEEGLAQMKAGGSAMIVVPPDLAFGDQGYGIIPANSQIILEVDLITVEDPPQPTTVADSKLSKTDSGLQYADLEEGDGPEVIQNTYVSTHFTIWVKGDSGSEYIMSSAGTEPLQFIVGLGDTVFPGWEEGMLGMKASGKRLLVIPPELALGAQGGNGIPANATLIMEVELVELQEPVKQTEVDEEDYLTTDSGLKYYDIVVGEGDMPTAGQTVVVHYTGWLEDGTQFDSSVDRGKPFSFVLGQGDVIAGWDEGVATMQVGGKRQLVIPAELGYGAGGPGSTIPPGATLIFDVELLEIVP